MNLGLKTLTAAAIFFLCGGPLADAGLVTWTIDSPDSELDVVLPDQLVTLYNGATVTVQARSQTTVGSGGNWSVGNHANLAGTFGTDYNDGNSIQFLAGQSNIVGLDSGNYRPNPAAYAGGTINPDGTASGGIFSNTTTAAGVFGARLHVVSGGVGFDAAFVSFYDLVGDLSSAVLPLAGTSFPANGISVLGNSLLAEDGLIGVNDGIERITLLAGTNTASLGTIVDAIGPPLLRELVMPINIPVNIYVPSLSPNPLTGTVFGTLVATATVPEPSTGMLCGIGAVVLGIASWRRRRRSRS